MAETTGSGSTGYRVEADVLTSIESSIRTRSGEARALGGRLGAGQLDPAAFGRVPWLSSRLYRQYRDLLDAGVAAFGEYAGALDADADFLGLVRRSTSDTDHDVFARYRSLAPNTGFGR